MSIVSIPEMITAVVGAPIDMHYTIVQYTDAFDVIIALGEDGGMGSMNLSLLIPQVEGIDFPFFQRFDSLEETSPWTWDYSLVPFIESDFIAPTPALLASTPTNEPLFNLPNDLTADVVVLQWMAAADDVALRNAADVDSLFPAPLGQLTYNDTVCRLLEEIQRHMLEPVIDEGVSWQLWTEDEVRGAIYERVCSFLLSTGLTRERITVPVAAGEARPNIPQEIIEVRRVQWEDAVNGKQTLLRSDEMQLDNYEIDWESTNGAPVAYVEQPTPTLTFKLSPTPANAGTLNMMVVLRPANLDGCSAFPIPAMFVPYIKYGVMADMLLKEGEANDPERSVYCEKRFAEGVDLALALIGGEK